MLRRALLISAALLLPQVALAQSGEDKAAARELGQEGDVSLEHGDAKKAEDLFRRADALFHAPTLVLGLARAQAKQGRFADAWESYHRIIVENVTSSPAFAHSLSEAKTEIAAVEKRRARINVTVSGAPSPRVTINDAAIRAEALGVPRYVNPGHIVVVASADGFQAATRAIDLPEGGDQSVALSLQAVAPAAPAATAGQPAVVAPTPMAPEPEPAPASSGARKPLVIASFALGGAGLILGGVTGGIALGDQSTLKNECAGGTCRSASSQSDLSTYHTMETLSTVGFIVGAVGIAGGLTLLLTTPRAEKAANPATASVTPMLGFGTIGAVGTF